MKTFILSFNLLLFFFVASITSSDLAIIQYPIIDMCDNPCDFQNLPASNEAGFQLYNRIHQGLFNELVHCIEIQDNYAKVVFDTIKNLMPSDTPSFFWTPVKNLIPLQNLKNSRLSQAIPHPSYGQEPTIVLLRPWKNFSVGTRFKHLPEHDTKKNYGIIRADFKKHKLIFDSVPHQKALKEIKKNNQAARALFVAIINELLDDLEKNHPDQIIPYVWGGCSFSQYYKKNSFYKKNGAWEQNGPNNPYSGYDCSGFIMKMAQIAGLDFPWQTSYAMKFSMKKLSKHNQLQNGDIIWIQGHVIIISNIARNEIIESTGYGGGYGCLHRLKLNERLKDITNYEELLDYYYANKPITFKKKIGEWKESDAFEILKLC